MKTPSLATDHLIKCLKIRSNRRGTKEMDIILGGFSEHHLHQLDRNALDLYAEMLNENDIDLYLWITKKASPPQKFMDLIRQIQFTLNCK